MEEHASSSYLCLHACAPFRSFPSSLSTTSKSTTTTTRASRASFASIAATSLLPSTLFTNHESLPSLPDALSNFVSAYPDYSRTLPADDLRHRHYPHLSRHVPLDYSGFPLFSPSQPPSFTLSSSNPNTQLQSAMTKRITTFLNIPPEDYQLVFAANRASALKLLADSYPFHTHKRLLTVYDYASDSVAGMEEAACKRGAKAMSACFSWPSMRIHSAKLKKMLLEKKDRSGLFVFPLQSRITGCRYSYLWMSFAQQNGWHVVLDACAVGPKDMDTLGLSLFRPDFLICSFFKVFGEDPSGFACLLIKRNNSVQLDGSSFSRSVGIACIVPAQPPGLSSDTESDTTLNSQTWDSGPIARSREIIHGEASEPRAAKPEIVELDGPNAGSREFSIECWSLDHADSLGLALISSRTRYIVNWLVVALAKLQHPHSGDGKPLVRIYGPKIKFDRGPSIAFNLFDWKGEKVDPSLVQKLADRSNISLACSFLHNIWFSDKHEAERHVAFEKRAGEGVVVGTGGRKKERLELGVHVVTLTLGFLASFEDAYKLWVFIAKFLDADFVEKERWRYGALHPNG